MSEATPTKVQISPFQIKSVSDVSRGPVTPVKIAPPPVTVKRSKSLKSDRSNFKRYVSVPNPSRETFTLPRQATAPNITITDKQKTDKQTSETEQKAVGKQTPDKADVNKCVHGNGISKNKSCSNGTSTMPEPASWQTVVNTHRRGSSMTFVSTQNWAQFDTASQKEEHKPAPFEWNISVEQWSKYEESFHTIKPLHGFISGKQSREYLMNTGLSRESLAEIWDLADMDHDGSLSLAEFAVAIHCVHALEAGDDLPNTVPAALRDSLLFHINNRNTILSALNKTDKSPEKSSLKGTGSISKGASVKFSEDSVCEAPPRRRPRPTRKLLSTTPLHLRPGSIQSSSSYYSSDNSEEESEPVTRKLDLSNMGSEKKKHGDKKKDRKKKEKSSESDTKSPDSPTAENGKPPVRRERTYEDVDAFIDKLEIQEGDEDVEALISNSEDEGPSSPSAPPPAGPPPARAASRRGPPPSAPPPSSPPPSSPPIQEEEESGVEMTTTSPEDATSSSEREQPENVQNINTGYERLTEDKVEPPTILLNEGETIESDEAGGDPDLTPRNPVSGGIGDVTISSGDVIISPVDVTISPDDVIISPVDVTISPDDVIISPFDVTISPDDVIISPGDVIISSGDVTPSEEGAVDKLTDLPILRTDIPQGSIKKYRSGSVDSGVLTYCPEKKEHDLPLFGVLSPVCSIDVRELAAEEDELKVEFEKKLWDLDKVPESEAPDLTKLNQTELDDLRTMIRDYELHNNALVNVARELRVELLKIQEQKYHLMSTLKCMKKI